MMQSHCAFPSNINDIILWMQIHPSSHKETEKPKALEEERTMEGTAFMMQSVLHNYWLDTTFNIIIFPRKKEIDVPAKKTKKEFSQ